MSIFEIIPFNGQTLSRGVFDFDDYSIFFPDS